jgi:hypothetical protein
MKLKPFFLRFFLSLCLLISLFAVSTPLHSPAYAKTKLSDPKEQTVYHPDREEVPPRLVPLPPAVEV